MNPNVPPPGYGQPTQPYLPTSGPWSSHPMMSFLGNNQGAAWFASILWFATWILVIALLASLVRWLWKKGDKIR